MQEIKTNPTVRHTTPLQLLAAFAATVAVLFVLLLGACALPAQPVLGAMASTNSAGIQFM